MKSRNTTAVFRQYLALSAGFIVCLLVCNLIWAIPFVLIWNAIVPALFHEQPVEPTKAFLIVLACRGIISQWHENKNAFYQGRLDEK
jgi:hypothetical protein